MLNFGGNFLNIDLYEINRKAQELREEQAKTQKTELDDLNLGNTVDGSSVSSTYVDDNILGYIANSSNSFGIFDFGGMDFGFKNLKIGNLDIGKGSVNISDESIKALKSGNLNMTPNLNLTNLKIKLLLMRFKYVIGGIVIVGGYFAYKKFKK